MSLWDDYRHDYEFESWNNDGEPDYERELKVHRTGEKLKMILIKENIIRETEKALLIELKESEKQDMLFSDVELQVKELWVPKSIILNDWQADNMIDLPGWFLNKNFGQLA